MYKNILVPSLAYTKWGTVNKSRFCNKKYTYAVFSTGFNNGIGALQDSPPLKIKDFNLVCLESIISNQKVQQSQNSSLIHHINNTLNREFSFLNIFVLKIFHRVNVVQKYFNIKVLQHSACMLLLFCSLTTRNIKGPHSWIYPVPVSQCSYFWGS